jgi:hypothetical protein
VVVEAAEQAVGEVALGGGVPVACVASVVRVSRSPARQSNAPVIVRSATRPDASIRPIP